MDGHTTPVLRFDHAVIAVRNLGVGKIALEAAGFHTAGGGVHEGKGTANELVRLTTGYLELLTVADREHALAHGGSRRQAAEFLDTNDAGPLGFAMEVADVHDCQARLATAGIRTSGPHAMARTQPDGRQIRWRTILIDDRQWLSPHPFLIQWEAGTDRWVGATSLHPNGVDQVSKIVVSSPDIDTTLQVYRVLGADDIQHTPGGASMSLADIQVVVRPTTDSTPEGGLLSIVLDGMPNHDYVRQLRSGALASWLTT